jgi:hypothetical protein
MAKYLFIELTKDRTENLARYTSVKKTLELAGVKVMSACGMGYYGHQAALVCLKPDANEVLEITAIKNILKDKKYFDELTIKVENY